MTDLGATKLVDRAECEAYDDEPMAQWTDRLADALGSDGAVAVAPTRPAPVAEPFTRNRPLRVPLARNVLLTLARRPRRSGSSASTCRSTT